MIASPTPQTTSLPREGDIVVWTGMPGNQYGHIAVATGMVTQTASEAWIRTGYVGRLLP